LVLLRSLFMVMSTRDKKVVEVSFVRFRAPLHIYKHDSIISRLRGSR
jgi:hypothetical protein